MFVFGHILFYGWIQTKVSLSDKYKFNFFCLFKILKMFYSQTASTSIWEQTPKGKKKILFPFISMNFQ